MSNTALSASKRVPPSAEDDALARRLEPSPTNRRAKSLARFNYWDIPEINTWIWGDDQTGNAPARALAVSLDTHLELERQYGNAHRSGDPTAIFDYVRCDTWCFRSAWVVEQLELWRDNGDGAKLRKVMTTFARNVSKVPTAKLRTEVMRDQSIFKRVVERPEGQSLNTWFGILANEFNVSEDTIRDVTEAYRPYFEEQLSADVTARIFFERLADMLKRFP